MNRITRDCVCAILVGFFALAVLSGTAGAETLKWRQGLRITQAESTAVGSEPGRVVGIGDSSGVAFFENGDVAATGTHFTFFYTDGSGPAEAFAPFTDKEQNDKEAMRYRKAAEGDASAQSSLGFMYAKGQGVTQDYKEAVKWYRKAADQGDAIAQYYLGLMYEKGRGVKQDYITAHMWLNLAGAHGVSRVRDRPYTVSVEKKMTAADVSKAQKLAREWAAKHPKN